ncbi:MAG: FAD binding domain-containing protein, partial [Desulfurococcaceae archaeon]
MFIHSFDIYRPRSLAEALEFLAKNSPDVKPLAGGTELLLLIRDRKIPTP